ncbi:SIR2 family protein [Empedobacter tilapiae]|uniref:SIR2 family protein n=1 Tax=Empedobacter tilapiae TaxID=2491114 RepID=UPI0028D88D34|nr:SIR2 family protein [Empedobacter tilapiae]
MDIKEFVSNFKSHPVLFIGTGISLRYLENSYNWDELLKSICNKICDNNEKYLDIKAKYINESGQFDYPKVGEEIEVLFNEFLNKNRDGEFKYINDEYYRLLNEGKLISKFKLYIASLLEEINFKEDKLDEIELFKQLKFNISSIITTNYDTLIENTIKFKPLISNDILLTNPYGALYKIHGCVTDPTKIIISENDYKKSKDKDELIRAQLLSLFIHNPVIFLGYGAQDENVNNILKTVFKYTEYNTESFNKIRDNFLIVEYKEASNNFQVSDYHLKIDDVPIQIKKLETDDYSTLYKELIGAKYPISAIDIRKVQNIMHEIIVDAKSADKKSVKEVIIVDSKEEIKTDDRVLVITYGNNETAKSIKQTIFKEKMIPEHMTVIDFISNYFEIISEKDIERIKIIDQLSISKNTYFPIYGFKNIFNELSNSKKLEQNQINILLKFKDRLDKNSKNAIKHYSIEDIYKDSNISESAKHPSIFYNVWNNNITLENLELYLLNYSENKNDSNYRRLVTLYDYKFFKEYA